LPFEEGCKVEQRLFIDCLFSQQSKSLIHVFFSEREVSKIPDIPKETPIIPVRSAALSVQVPWVVASPWCSPMQVLPVLLKEADQAALDRGTSHHPVELREFRQARRFPSTGC